MENINVESKSSEFISIINEQFQGKVNLARLKLISMFVIALYKVQTLFYCNIAQTKPLLRQPALRVLQCAAFPDLQVEPGVAGAGVGEDGADAGTGVHCAAFCYEDFVEVGIYGEVFTMADDDHVVELWYFDYSGNRSFEDGSGKGVLFGEDVDAVVFYFYAFEYRVGMFTIR